MIKKIKKIIRDNIRHQEKQINLLKELDWANVYHDSIRGYEWIEKSPLNVGRWAGSYSFFYVLNRILKDCRPNTILEFGLGESTKFVTTYLEHYLLKSTHLVIEHDAKWKASYLDSNRVSSRTKIEVFPLEEKKIKSYMSNSYKGIDSSINSIYDLYIIDGPFGSPNYSRYDIVDLAQGFKKTDEFIILIDDYHRNGEQDTAKDLLSLFSNKGIIIHKAVYDGIKSVLVIATENYKYLTSI